ncbi:MAG: TolC family protein [Planctomycetes bacterium]|nr:TolC family protein [Planctomycetota bacterium]
MRHLAFLALFALAAAPLFAQDAAPPPEPPKPAEPEPKFDPFAGDSRRRVKMTLEDCVRAALDSNLDLKYSQLEPELFRGDINGFKGPYDPIVYVDGTRSSSKKAATSSLSGATILDDDLWTAAMGVKGTWFLGTTYDINYQASRDATNNTFSTLDPRWDSSVGFSLRQPLLKNAWLDYQTLSLRVLENSYKSSVHHVSQDTIGTLYSVELSYWTLVNAIRQKAVKVRSLEVSQRLYEVNRNKVKAGALAPIEELRAESDVAGRREGIILAANDIENAMDDLRHLIRPFDQPSDWDFIIEPADDPTFEKQAVNLDSSVNEAIATRPELEQLRLSIETSKLDQKRYERELWPTLDLTGSVRYSGVGGNLGDSFEQLRTWDFSSWSVGVIFEYPLGTHGPRGALIRAEAQQRRADLALRSQEQGIVLEVRSAARELNSGAERIEVTRKATELARRALEAEQARYDRGLSTSHQVLQFLTDEETAAANEAKAVVDYKIAELKLRKATGGLLKERASR